MKDSIFRREFAQPSRFCLPGSANEADILAALRAEGITTLEQLVSHQLTKLREGPPTPVPLVGVEKVEQGLQFHHVAPRIPVMIDGVEYEPADISRFDGTPLHFIYHRLANGRPLFQATSDRNQVNTLSLIWSFVRPKDYWTGVSDGDGRVGLGRVHDPAQQTQGSGSAPEPDEGPPNWWASVQMFSDDNYGGDWCWLENGYQIAHLSKISRNTVLFFSGDWNDQINSLAGTGGPVTYFEHANFQGSTLTIPPGQPMPELRSLGWNDRISSVRFPAVQL